MSIAQLGAVIALVLTISGATWAGYEWLDGRYAKVEQVGVNAQQIAIIRIENAAASGNRVLLRRLCDDFRQVYGWTPSACR